MTLPTPAPEVASLTDEAIEQAVVDRLAEQMTDFRVELFPDNVGRYPFTTARELLLVGWDRSTFGEALSIDPVSQERTRQMSITLFVRALRGPLGAGRTIDRIHQALIGWRAPQGGTAFVAVSDGFVEEDNGVWKFAVVVSTQTMFVGVENPPTAYGTMQRATFNPAPGTPGATVVVEKPAPPEEPEEP